MLADFFVCSTFSTPITSGVAYLASYLSHGKFLTTSFVDNILERLVVWCLEYCKKFNGGINPGTC
ncbi:unnamed protein product, partial [Vitis vinifera]|uniref:Uncharacterized protein n=1 Tax=Vitis vinifera TaxID=29760 RepID=D7U4A0_VITVI